MKAELNEIIELCEATENKHFQWFSKLIKRHFDGMALMPSSVYRMGKLRESTTRLRLLDGRDTVTLTMNTSSSRSSMPAEGSMSGTSHHTEKVIEPN